MQTLDSVRSGAAAPHNGQSYDRVSGTADFDKASRRNFERRENCRALPVDILSHGLFTLRDLRVRTKHFDQYVDWNCVASLFPLVRYKHFGDYLFRFLLNGPKPGPGFGRSNLVKTRGIACKASRRVLAHKRHADFHKRARAWLEQFQVSHQRPYA